MSYWMNAHYVMFFVLYFMTLYVMSEMHTNHCKAKVKTKEAELLLKELEARGQEKTNG